jgi:hypothetical protein
MVDIKRSSVLNKITVKNDLFEDSHVIQNYEEATNDGYKFTSKSQTINFFPTDKPGEISFASPYFEMKTFKKILYDRAVEGDTEYEGAARCGQFIYSFLLTEVMPSIQEPILNYENEETITKHYIVIKHPVFGPYYWGNFIHSEGSIIESRIDFNFTEGTVNHDKSYQCVDFRIERKADNQYESTYTYTYFNESGVEVNSEIPVGGTSIVDIDKFVISDYPDVKPYMLGRFQSRPGRSGDVSVEENLKGCTLHLDNIYLLKEIIYKG